MNTHSISESAVLETLRQVIDPELGCNIVDLGLVYSVAISGSKVSVMMTLTTPGCPMHDSIQWGAQNALLNLEGVDDAEVEVVWDPPWHPSMMTDAGRKAAGAERF
ncbi:MAG TPA: metal-sulfur cluster assembly factor [Candidatus Paceibacterota bacterium]|nr:metal-sulfur cluster assembly factor [Candidatus Paceibacterota bacterium]